MIGIPMNPNSVHISMLQTECCKTEFDSTYPIHLNGIIGQDEFRESINKINHRINTRLAIICLTIIFAFGIVAGTACTMIGAVTTSDSRTNGFSPLIGVGIGLTTLGTLFFVFGALLIQFKRVARMREAIAEESMKYSSRSPTPCSWRVETAGNFVGGYGNQYNRRTLYCIVIDIGRSSAPGSNAYYSNQVANESAFTVEQHNDYPPPSYSSQSAGYCSQCGAIRKDHSARFCSSCGQSFNKK